MCEHCKLPTHALDQLSEQSDLDLSGLCDRAREYVMDARDADPFADLTEEEPEPATDHYLRLVRAMRAERSAWARINEELRRRSPASDAREGEDPEADKWWNLRFVLEQALGNGPDLDERPDLEDIEYGVLEGVLAVLDEPTLDVEHLVLKSAAAARAWHKAEPLDPAEAYCLEAGGADA